MRDFNNPKKTNLEIYDWTLKSAHTKSPLLRIISATSNS